MEVQSRTKAALEIINQGQSVRVGELLISRLLKSCLAVTGWTQCIHLDTLTRGVALEELAGVKQDFEDITTASEVWKEYVKDKALEYNLAYDDNGKAGIRICREENGEVTWLYDIQK